MAQVTVLSSGAAGAPAAAPPACPGCGTGRDPVFLYGLRDIPVQSALLLPDRAAALGFPRGDLDLLWCPECGLAYNGRFDPARVAYGAGYEDSQGASPTFTAFATELARGWIDRHGLAGGHIVEIGCGKGDFLRLICAEGGCTGAGYDPAYVPGRAAEPAGVTFRAESFTEAHGPVAADFLVCRHTLEHVGDVAGFLRMLRRACGAGRGIRLGVEVPDLRRILAEGAFWDVYYEHASYFTAGALARAVRAAGFEVLDLRRVYGGQYLVIDARPAEDGAAQEAAPPLPAAPLPALADDLEETAALVARFRDTGLARLAGWRDAFAEWERRGLRVALWGSGSKAVGFLTGIGVPGPVAAVADINPARHGAFMPGCPVPIAAPAELAEIAPDVVIAMNAIYRDEIAADLAGLGLAPVLLTADGGPPAERPPGEGGA